MCQKYKWIIVIYLILFIDTLKSFIRVKYNSSHFMKKRLAPFFLFNVSKLNFFSPLLCDNCSKPNFRPRHQNYTVFLEGEATLCQITFGISCFQKKLQIIRHLLSILSFIYILRGRSTKYVKQNKTGVKNSLPRGVVFI